MEDIIDLRSDTVTRPSPAMRKAIEGAAVGDDVFGDDPTVKRLESVLAERVGMEAGLFVPSGTQSNLIALMSHCERGDEYLVGQTAHTYRYEAGGAAVLGSIQPQPIDFEPDGTLNLGTVAKYVKPDDAHFARTRLLCLENTTNGKALALEYLEEARAFVEHHELLLHLDGARVFNAAVEQDVEVDRITGHFDSVSVCLSKGLGAPIGSVLCGSEDFVARAHRWRKMVGGGMRQVGILAAAGLFALEHNVARLADDHANAQALGDGLGAIDGIEIRSVSTNMVFVELVDVDPDLVSKMLEEEGILVRPGSPMRLVTHLDVGTPDVKTTVEAFAKCLGHLPSCG